MSLGEDTLFYKLVEEFEGDKDDWIYEDMGKFIRWLYPDICKLDRNYENRNRSGRMALGHVIMLTREQRDELWSRFLIERDEQ